MIKQKQKKQKGFTLLELLIVITIIGILAGIVLVSFPSVTKKAKLANALTFSDNIRGSLQPDMIVWWKFDEVSGATIAKDTWWNQLDGTVVGATFVEGIKNNALSFDGNDYVSIGNSAVLDVADSPFSVSLWFKHTMTAGNVVGILEIGGVSPAYSITTGYLDAGQDKLSFIVGGGWRYDIGSGLNDGRWHNFVATKNGTTYTFYVDSIIKTGLKSLASQLGTNNIGRGTYGYFTGSIDDVQIYSAALPVAVIQQLYADGLATHQNLAIK